jgi:dTDP-4-amino-4,6-dideoxygalactose transaminase
MTHVAPAGRGVAFPERVPFVRPAAPPLERVTEILSSSWARGALTNGPLVAELEQRAATFLGVRHVVAVASCTTGLMLTLRALDVDLDEQDVLMPSFTFSASAHAVAWNGARPRFAECDRETFQLDLADARARIAGARAILATHVFGAPCAPEELEQLARQHNIPLVFDAAHAFGATTNGIRVGSFGTAEVFSLTPTKPLVAGEGGLVATNYYDIAESVRLGRDYANPGDYNTRFVGLNGRMSEMHAATALASLESFERNQTRRFEIVERYRAGLAPIPGIAVQTVSALDQSSWKDFTITVDAAKFGVDRDTVEAVLDAEGVDTRRYFDPPVHRQHAYRHDAGTPLPATDTVSSRVLSLPAFPSLSDETVDCIVQVIGRIHDRSHTLPLRPDDESSKIWQTAGTGVLQRDFQGER